MTTLMGIIALHLLVIISGRKFKNKGLLENTIIIILTLLLVGWVALGMYMMEKPEPRIGF